MADLRRLQRKSTRRRQTVYFLTTLGAFALVVGAVMASVLAPLHAYTPLVGINRITVSDTSGNAWAVCDPAMIARFVSAADDYRNGWHGLPWEETFTDYSIGYYHDFKFEQDLKISPGTVYRRGDEETVPVTRDPAEIWTRLLPLIQQVINNPNIPRYGSYNITHGPPAGWSCDRKDTVHAAPSSVTMRTQDRSYPLLTGVNRITIIDSSGFARAVCDRAMIAKFVAVANEYRDEWRGLPSEPLPTDYNIGFDRARQIFPRKALIIAPGVVYRRDDELKLSVHDPAPLWRDLYPLIQEVTGNPAIRVFRGTGAVAYGDGKGWWCH